MARQQRDRKGKGKSLRRKVGTRLPRRTLLVLCEGKRTEADYLKALKHDLAARGVVSVDIRIDRDTHGFAPLTLVRAAIEARDRANCEKGEIDEVWCIFDVEQPNNHPNLVDAIELAERSDVNVAISNPCFELWLLLHFQDQSAWLDTNSARRQLKQHDGTEGKGIDGTKYMLRRDEAARRARSLQDRHRGNGSKFPGDNPSSGMHRFLAAVERSAEE